MKRPIGIISIFLLVLLFIACEKTPDKQYPESIGVSQEASVMPNESELAEESKERESSEKSHSGEKSIELISLEEARKEAAEICGQTVEGFMLPDKIVVTDGDIIPVYKVSEHHCESYKIAEDCFRKLIPRYDDIIAASAEPHYYYKYDENNLERITGVTYRIESDNDYGEESTTVAENGFIYNDGTIVSFATEPVEKYDIEWGDDYTDDEGFELSDGFVTIKDAVEFAEKRINDNLCMLYDGVDKFKVQHLYVFKNLKNGKYVYKMIVGFVFNGQALDTANIYYDSRGGKDKYTASGRSVICVMERSDSFDMISNCSSSMDFEKIETVDRIISPKTALKIIKRELALGGIDGFGQAGLISFSKARDLHYGESLTDEELMEASVIRPYWVFTNRQCNMNDNTGGNYDAHENTVFVDAVTGSVFFCSLTSLVPY